MTREEKNKILADKNSSENATALGGVDKDTLGKVNSTFTNSSTQTQAQGKASNQLTNYENIANKDSIVSNKTWNTINQSFKTPTAVTEADAYLKGALSKIQSGKTSYSDSVREMMDKITNRDKFSYDVDNDPLFQQALASAMNSGKSAMQDTIGQASALTGGYGSSYATSAANQAYNAFIEDAYDNLPQYYQMALDAYNAEGDELYRQLDMYNSADEKEYGRMLNAYDATGTYRDRLYNEAYQQFRDTKSDAFASANLQLSEHGQLSNDALNLYNAYVNEADKMYEREFQKWDAEVRNAMQYAQMLNSDWWKGEEYKQADEHFYENLVHDTEEADKDRQHDIDMQEDMQAHQSNENLLDRTWKSEEADKDRTWKSEEAAIDRQHQFDLQNDAQSFTASENAKDRATKTSSGGGGTQMGGLKLTSAQLNAAKEASDLAGGGDAGFKAALNELGLYGVYIEEGDSESASMLYDALNNGKSSPNIAGHTNSFIPQKNSSFKITTSSGTKTMINNGEVTGTEIKSKLKNYNVAEGDVFTHDGKMYIRSGDKYYYISQK
jgi:hypothetical protein